MERGKCNKDSFAGHVEGTAGCFFGFCFFFFFFFEHDMELTYPQIMTLYDHLSMKGSFLVLFLKISFLYPQSQGNCCLLPSVPTLIYFIYILKYAWILIKYVRLFCVHM